MDDLIPRGISDRIIDSLKYFPAVAITGARQVGKTTLLRMLCPDADFVTFDPYRDIENARADPDLFLSNHGRPLVLDEIQFAPEVAAGVKRAIDKDRKPGSFIITGSQQWQVMKMLGDSLAGRIALFPLDALSWEELSGGKGWVRPWLESGGDPESVKSTVKRDTMPLYERIWRGWMPGILKIPNDHIGTFHDSYFSTYLERDIRMLADIRDGAGFARFAMLQASLSGTEINASQTGREVGVMPATAKAWRELMEATFQVFSVSAWSGNVVKRVSQKPKGFFSETGLACRLLALSSPQALASYPALGFLFESMVVCEIMKQTARMSLRPKLWHWRSNGGAEVDLVLEFDNRLFPIEIKLSSHPGRSDGSGINAYRKSFPSLSVANGLIVAPVEKSYPVDSMTWVVPWDGLCG